jgi:hypothetical protein
MITNLGYTHLVSRKCPRLVRTNYVRRAKGLHTGQVSHNRILLCHLLRAQCKTSSDNGSQTLRNGSHGQCDGNLEVVHGTLERTMVGRVPEVAHVDEPDEDANDRDDLGEHVAEIVQLALQWCLFADLGRDGFVNIANGSLLTSENDNGTSRAVYNRGSLRSRRMT